MRLFNILVLTLVGSVIPQVFCGEDQRELRIRQETTGEPLPPLTTNNPDATPTNTEGGDSSGSVSAPAASESGNADESSSAASSSEDRSTSSPSRTQTVPSTSAASTTSTASSSSATAETTEQDHDELPLQPAITPAVGMAGVFLIILGAVYNLNGVKSRWIQISLSTGFLASIGTTVLVAYVMNPPLSDSVQGGFFVAIFMTGLIFGAGALVFKEFTEGFGCLLGGFCLSMWLLTLRAGGLITSSAGKGAFIGIFCIVCWALSFSQYTRPYAMIGSTSFGGATAFVLGVDCFTRAGMKEFWFYLWDLNDDLFPLGTETYPLTRGIRVEIAVIVIGTIIGVLSQVKLWKVVRSKQKEEEKDKAEEERKQEEIDAALGRHLQRQNEREKSEWEKQYGDRLQSKRSTILWQEAHPEKRHSSVSVVAIQQRPYSGTGESLEMNAFGPRRPPSTYGSKNKRQSTVAVDVIEEVDEGGPTTASDERQKALAALENSEETEDTKVQPTLNPSTSRTSLKSTNMRGARASTELGLETSKEGTKEKRSSLQSLTKLATRAGPGANVLASESQEHLIDEADRPYSRASSVAATMDIENEQLDVNLLDANQGDVTEAPPEIVISTVKDNSPQGALPVQENRDNLNGTLQQPSKTDTDDQGTEKPLSNSSSVKDDAAVPPLSHTSDATNTSADSLTKDALATVPSQMSNVVLTYRTNEWAKHISVAEAPIYDEPESIGGADDELPTHLAKPSQEPEATFITEQERVEVPPPEPLQPSVKASSVGVGIATSPAAAKRSFSEPENGKTVPQAPSRSASTQSLRPSGARISRSSFNLRSSTSLVSSPIDENTPATFISAKPLDRRASGGSPYFAENRASTSSAIGRSTSRLSSVYGSVNPTPASTPDLLLSGQLSNQKSRPQLVQNTRLNSYDSHQPPRKDPQAGVARRESLLAEWRLSQHHQATNNTLAGNTVESGLVQLKLEKDQQKMVEDFHRTESQRKQYAMDQVMRRPDMQELHREAMRKMQAGVNKNLKTANE